MTPIEKNIAKSKLLGEKMDRAASKVVSGLDKASRSRTARSRSAVTGRYVTVSGKVRTIR